jgi:uncharacterized protein Yka (UPF0111/DUF47 family)
MGTPAQQPEIEKKQSLGEYLTESLDDQIQNVIITGEIPEEVKKIDIEEESFQKLLEIHKNVMKLEDEAGSIMEQVHKKVGDEKFKKFVTKYSVYSSLEHRKRLEKELGSLKDLVEKPQKKENE